MASSKSATESQGKSSPKAWQKQQAADVRLKDAAPDLFSALVEAREYVSDYRDSIIRCGAVGGDEFTLDASDANEIVRIDASLTIIDNALAKAGAA